jgi:hypothetical protein
VAKLDAAECPTVEGEAEAVVAEAEGSVRKASTENTSLEGEEEYEEVEIEVEEEESGSQGGSEASGGEKKPKKKKTIFKRIKKAPGQMAYGQLREEIMINPPLCDYPHLMGIHLQVPALRLVPFWAGHLPGAKRLGMA